MKKIFNFIIFMLSLLLITGCSNKKCVSDGGGSASYSKADVGKIISINEVDKKLPDINISIMGKKINEKIDKSFFDDLKVYEVETVIFDDDNYYNIKFLGVRFIDFLQKLDFKNKKVRSFEVEGLYAIKDTFEYENINNDYFLIFSLNNEDIVIKNKTNYLTLINIKDDSSNWIYGIYNIHV